MKNLFYIITLGLVFNLSAQAQKTRSLTINKKDEGFSLYCKAKLQGLNNIDTIDAIKTDFGKKIKDWKYDASTGQVLIEPSAFGGIQGFFNLKFIIGAATITQQIFSRATTFLVDEDLSLPAFSEIISVKFCGKEIERYELWGSNGILVNDFDVSTNCQDEVVIEIIYNEK